MGRGSASLRQCLMREGLPRGSGMRSTYLLCFTLNIYVNRSEKRDHFALFHRIFQLLAIFTIPYLSNHQ